MVFRLAFPHKLRNPQMEHAVTRPLHAFLCKDSGDQSWWWRRRLLPAAGGRMQPTPE